MLGMTHEEFAEVFILIRSTCVNSHQLNSLITPAMYHLIFSAPIGFIEWILNLKPGGSTRSLSTISLINHLMKIILVSSPPRSWSKAISFGIPNLSTIPIASLLDRAIFQSLEIGSRKSSIKSLYDISTNFPRKESRH